MESVVYSLIMYVSMDELRVFLFLVRGLLEILAIQFSPRDLSGHGRHGQGACVRAGLSGHSWGARGLHCHISPWFSNEEECPLV